MQTATITPTKTVATAPVPALAFSQVEWKAFENGLQCSLMGYTHDELRTARNQWSKGSRWAWDCGFNKAEKLMGRADVQLALVMRFGEI